MEYIMIPFRIYFELMVTVGLTRRATPTAKLSSENETPNIHKTFHGNTS
jgi:hypothetical protein